MSLFDGGFLDPPGGRTSFSHTMAYNIWAYRMSRIERLIDELAAAPDPNDPEAQDRALANAGFLDTNDLTAAEIDYVQNEIAKRWNK